MAQFWILNPMICLHICHYMSTVLRFPNKSFGFWIWGEISRKCTFILHLDKRPDISWEFDGDISPKMARICCRVTQLELRDFPATDMWLPEGTWFMGVILGWTSFRFMDANIRKLNVDDYMYVATHPHMCYSHVDVWFILIHSHHFNTYVSFQKDCLCVHHPDVLPNLMQLLAKWFLQQSNCAAVEMTIFSTKGDKIFSTRVASFTSCGLSHGLMGQHRSTFRRQLLVILCIHAAIHFFGDQQFDPDPSPAQDEQRITWFWHSGSTCKNILQIGPSTPCSVCATSGGDFETSYNFYQEASHVERSCSSFRVMRGHEVFQSAA